MFVILICSLAAAFAFGACACIEIFVARLSRQRALIMSCPHAQTDVRQTFARHSPDIRKELPCFGNPEPVRNCFEKLLQILQAAENAASLRWDVIRAKRKLFSFKLRMLTWSLQLDVCISESVWDIQITMEALKAISRQSWNLKAISKHIRSIEVRRPFGRGGSLVQMEALNFNFVWKLPSSKCHGLHHLVFFWCYGLRHFAYCQDGLKMVLTLP